MKDHSSTLQAGDTAPEFQLLDSNSRRFQLSDYRGRCLLIIFICGTW